MISSLSPIIAPAAAFSRLLNKLLQQEPWARDQLSKHSGKTVKLCLGEQLNIKVGINSDGLTHTVPTAIKPNVILAIPSEHIGQLPQLLSQKDPAQITQILHIQGDAGLAQTVSDLAQNLRWDVEHTLAKYIGDISAVRVLRGGSAMLKFLTGTTRNITENFGEYLAHESNLMANQQAFTVYKSLLSSKLQRLDALEQRVSNLSKQTEHHRVGQSCAKNAPENKNV